MTDKRKIDKKIKNLIKHFGFKKQDLIEIKKMYSGEFFDSNDSAYLRLLQCSKNICNKYNLVLKEEMLQKSKCKNLKLNLFRFLNFYFKKSRILKLIFPIHGFILYAEEGINAIIGLVDLKGYGFINKNITFTPYSLVDIKKSNIFAFNIVIGDDALQNNGKLSKLSKISIDKNCWIGAGTKIYGNIDIGKNCVIGIGAIVKDSIPPYSLAVGRPCKVIRTITDKDKLDFSKKINIDYNDKQFDIIRKFSGKKIPKAFKDVINGVPFNSMNKKLAYLIDITRALCFEYNLDTTSIVRKQEILDTLFVDHGKNLIVGNGIYVDLLGTIKLGDNITIGENVFIGGNIKIGSNVKIGDNSILFSSGHSLISKERIMNWSIKQGFYEYTQYQHIIVESNLIIGKNAIVAPKSIANCDIPENALYVKNKIVN